MRTKEVLIDSGFLIALYDRSSVDHRNCRKFAELEQQRLLYPDVILVEVFHILKRNQSQQIAWKFVENFSRVNARLQPLAPEDMGRISQLLQQYADASLDFVDCALVAIAERLSITRIATLDRRDFSIIRPTHTAHFELYP